MKYDLAKKLSMKYDLAPKLDHHGIKYDGQNLSMNYDQAPPSAPSITISSFPNYSLICFQVPEYEWNKGCFLISQYIYIYYKYILLSQHIIRTYSQIIQ